MLLYQQQNTNMCHAELSSLEFSPHIWKAVRRKTSVLSAVLTILILWFKNKRCSRTLIDLIITCFKGSWQLTDPKTCKLKPENNFPEDNASPRQGSSNFQDTHKILEDGKESKKRQMTRKQTTAEKQRPVSLWIPWIHHRKASRRAVWRKPASLTSNHPASSPGRPDAQQ